MKIAFCGFRHGHIYTLYKLALENPDIEIVGGFEEDECARMEAMEKFPHPFYESYEALLKDENVDVVAVGDYYGIRAERIIQALSAGKHVISDKPICTSLDELNEIEALSEKSGLKVGCMLDLRYDPALVLAEKIVKSGEIGEICAINFTGQHPLNYGSRPMWYFEEGKHGGTFNDIAIHGVDAVKMITGLDKLTRISARQWNAFADQEKHFRDCAQMIGAYENGAGLLADVSYSVPAGVGFSLPTYWRFNFFGKEGSIEAKIGKREVLVAKKDVMEMRTADEVSDDFLKDFAKEIMGEKARFSTKDNFASARLALEIQASAKEW